MGGVATPGAAAEPSALVKALEPIKKGWKEASIPQRIILVLLPFAFVSVFFVFSEPEPEASEEPAPTATATAVASAPQPTDSATVARVEPPTPDGVDAGPDKKTTEPETPANGKTLQRKAADAVAAGDYEGAAKLYDQLSKRHPDKAVYREAADILRRKR